MGWDGTLRWEWVTRKKVQSNAIALKTWFPSTLLLVINFNMVGRKSLLFVLCQVLQVKEVSNPVDGRRLKLVQSVHGFYSSVYTRILSLQPSFLLLSFFLNLFLVLVLYEEVHSEY